MILPEEGRMGAKQEKPSDVQVKPFPFLWISSLFSGCLHFSLSPCLLLPLPNLSTLCLGGWGYLLSGAWA